jgi:parallel beta-helix repeat protein
VSDYIFTIAANNVTLGGDGTGFTINGTTTTTRGVAIRVTSGVTIQDNTFTNNRRGICMESGSVTNLTVRNNTITAPAHSGALWTKSDVGIWFYTGDAGTALLIGALITENTITNYTEAISIIAINNTVISNNTISGGYLSGISIDKRAGTATNNVTISGNTVTNITGDANAAGIAVDKHGGSVDTTNVTNITITENTVTGCKKNIALKRFSDDDTIGAADMSTIAVLHNNIASGVSYGLYNGHTAVLNATYNWWGNASGPGGVGPGTGDNVSTHVTYSPWRDAPYPDGNTTAFTNITLKKDWNFISVPRKLENATFGYLLSGQNISQSYGYDPSTGWIILNGSSPVEVLAGYWISANEAGTINLTFVSTGQEVPPSKNLTGKKWNAIGFSDTTALAANATLKSVEGSWSTAMGWNAADQCYDNSIIYSVNDSTTMTPGKGYWLWMTADDTLAALSA